MNNSGANGYFTVMPARPAVRTEVNMYKGTLIDDLMITVTRVEEHARREPVLPPVYAPARVAAYPAFSTFAYEWPMEHAIIGVA